MLQTKFCNGTNLQELENSINQALSEIKANDPKIIYHLEHLLAIIEYEKSSRKCMCVDCQHYDPSGDQYRKAYGLCQFHGERVRFSHETCRDFLDLRG